MTSQADKYYLSDIQGKLPLPDFDDLIKEEGLLGLLPENIAKYAEEIDKAEDDGVHSYLCNIDKAPNNCGVNRAIAEREKDRYVGYVQWDTNKPLRLLYSVNGSLEEREVTRLQKPITLAGTRKGGGYKERGGNLSRTVLGQGITSRPEGTFYTKSIQQDRKGDDRQLFHDAVEGKGNLSIGDRAVLFNQDGSVTTGANNIRDNAVANERSSNIPSESANNGGIPKKFKSALPYKTKNHPNKSRLAKTNDLAGGIAALGGIAAVIGIVALLMPQHFVTSAITFLTSITTFFTNVNNAVNTYLTVVDALLGLFGIKGSGKAMKGFIAQIVDNALGKENVQQIKNAFASGINTIAVTTKLLEKTQAMANNTDNLVDEVATRVGAVNNAMGAAGLIPEELMATSASIDTLVEKRTENNQELGDNLTALTAEIKDKEETTKELKNEAEAREKLAAKKAKDLDDVKGLLDGIKTDVDKIELTSL
jgi:hypothetical protein